jgi:predicted ATPase/class 3 adenylate cyclase
MAERPSGTVTFLFTDIEGSTRLLKKLGPELYRTALDEHRRILRGAFGDHRGHEVDTQGDAFLVAFHRAEDAVESAAEAQRTLAAQRWPEGHRIRVRMGIHTTEAMATSEGYVGIGLHRGARIAGAAHGGQILVSQTTSDLLGEDHGELRLIDLGPHRLKDLTDSQRIFQLAGPGLPDRFPPPNTLGLHPNNLPIQPTPMIGREREVAEIGALLHDGARMVTLTGPGGTGKTRLALQSAAELVEGFPDGVFFIGLALVADPEVVAPTIASVVGVNEGAGQDLSAYLATKSLLLVVDNFEHLMAASSLLAELLASAPTVKLLLTSREPLRLAAEHVYPVDPLGLPDLSRLPDVADLLRYEAVALFVGRAQAALSSFSLDEANAASVAEICVRLDGLPLALELAAARIAILSPTSMLKRLDEGLKLLTAGRRDAPSRQHTLRDTLAWSYDLLSADEARLFACLGAFAGRFSLEAVEAVCEADLDVLGSLVDKSLLRRDGERYVMLDTIREFAVERLEASGTADTVRERHARFFEDLAEAAYRDRHRRSSERADELEREHHNFRAALDWLEGWDRLRYARLAGALGWFWRVHSKFAEGRARLDQALAGWTAPDADRARALSAAGQLAAWQGDISVARSLLDEAISVWTVLGNREEVALALHELGWGYLFADDDQSARRYMEESLELQRSLGDPYLVNRAQLGLLQMLVATDDLATVPRLGEEALELSRRLGDVWSEHFAHHFLGDCAILEEDFPAAQARYTLSLEAAWRAGDEVETSFELQGMAMSAAGLGRAARALRIAAAADKRLQSLGVTSLPRFWLALLERYVARAKAQLSTEDAEAAWEAGRRMGFADAIQEALAVS